jgi:two-component system sensor histidine kinase BaeS
MTGAALTGPGRRRGGRPPWWPEGEPWPPIAGAWHGEGKRFVRRIWRLIGAMFLLFLVGGIFANWLAPGGGAHWDQGGPPGPVRLLGVIMIGAIAFGVVRAVRRTAAPIGDVMEAADRVAAGDYTVRVPARGQGEIGALVASFNQMTTRLQTNEVQRRSLLADVAHELRTPLAVIHGNIEGMIDGVYPRDDEHLTPILDETKVMARLLDDLRTLSMAEAGALRLHREPTDLGALVHDLVAAFAPRAAIAGVELTARVAVVPDVEVDPVRVRQVLENLIANALRHTPSGGTVRVRGDLTGGTIAFSVADTGSGIPAADLSSIFDRFWRSADSGGSGLGLAIARSLVEAHGGEIRAESQLGHGTTIHLSLPVA